MGASRLFFVLSDMSPHMKVSLPVPPRAFLAAPRSRVSWSRVPRGIETPFGRSRCRNTGRGPGLESSGRRLQGAATLPFARWAKGERNLPCRAASAERCLWRKDLEGQLATPPLAKTAINDAMSLGRPRGVCGGQDVPSARWAWYYHAHLVLKLNRP